MVLERGSRKGVRNLRQPQRCQAAKVSGTFDLQRESLYLGSIRPMGRPKRADDGGLICHVLNRANARMSIFEGDKDYEAFERILGEAVERTRTRLLAYCVMPDH